MFNAPGIFENHAWRMFDHLSKYSRRELSVEADDIRAFEGIFNNFKKMQFPIHHFLGIPIMQAVIQGSDLELVPARHSRSEAFAAGLSWKNTAPGTRRTQFPTWSWAGWTAEIVYNNSLCRTGLKLENESRFKVFVENHDGSLSDMDEYDDASLEQELRNSSGKFVHIEAWTIPITIQYMP